MIALAFKNPQLIYAIIPAAIILFLIIRTDFVRFKDYREQHYFRKERRPDRITIFFLRLITISLLILALAQPFELKQRTIQGSPVLNIFEDKSTSFDLFDSTTGERLANEISKSIPVNRKAIAEGNRSALGDSVLANIQGDDNVLIVTDGNSNYGRSIGDIMLLASSINTTISALSLEPEKSDAYVIVGGPSETTADIDNDFQAVVFITGKLSPFTLRVTVDNELVLEEEIKEPRAMDFKRNLKEGYHKIVAEISASDHFKGNNKFMKSVKVQPKPKVLFLSKKPSPLSKIISEVYEVTTASELPEGIDKYSAIIINDIRAEQLPVDRLAQYVLDGNGLMVLGGKSSFDKDSYKSPDYKPYEALLPVSVGAGKEEPKKEVNVVLLIDVSGSTGVWFDKGSRYTVEEVEKALAVSVLGDLKKTDTIGVIAFESVPHTVSDLQKLSETPELEHKIRTLSYGKGTDIGSGILSAMDMLSNAQGSKNIIMISDGIPGTPAAEDLRVAAAAGASGIKLYTVGVGERTNDAHMKKMAELGKGAYFEPKETEKIRVILGEGEKANDTYRLEIVNSHHFITSGIRLKASVTGYNFVLPKSSSQLLVTTAANVPILTAWRFGLGRIAVLSTDDGSSWGGELLGKENSGLITKATNWAIGDLSRNKEFDVDMDDIYLGDELEINVISRKQPESADFNFTKIGEKLYTARYTPREPGFYSFYDAIVAVNHDKELSRTGINPELAGLVSVTNGKMFSPGEVDEIIAKVKQDSRRIKTDTTSYAWVFALGAIMVFLAEIAARRVIETKRINKL